MGAIWNDANKNGLKENNESIMSGIVVKLVNDEEEELGQFVTNHAGLYCHQLVDEGNYFIEVIENLILKLHKGASTTSKFVMILMKMVKQIPLIIFQHPLYNLETVV